jgi:hypothetical protein
MHQPRSKRNVYLLVSLATWASALSTWPLQSAFAQTAPYAAIEKLLDSETAIVSWIDLKSLDLKATMSEMGLEEDTGLQSILDKAKELQLERVFVIGNGPALFGQIASEMALVIPCANPAIVRDGLLSLKDLRGLSHRTGAGLLFLALTESAIDSIAMAKDEPSPKLMQAIKSCSGATAIAVEIPSWLSSSFKGQINEDMSNHGFGFAARFLAEAQWLSTSGDFPPGAQQLQVRFSSSKACEQTIEMVDQYCLSHAMEAVKVQFAGDRASATVSTKTPLIRTMLNELKLLVETNRITTQMKQITLALYGFESKYGVCPPQSLTSKDGKPLLSWRVLLLPYLEQEALYQQFRLDEPWDSPNNIQLVDKIPTVFQALGSKGTAEGLTTFQAAMTKNSLMGKVGLPSKFASITDGTSNTVWLVESKLENSVPWTKPEDLVLDLNAPLAGIRIHGLKSIAVGLMDSSAIRLPANLDPKKLLELVSIDGGEVVDMNQLTTPAQP